MQDKSRLQQEIQIKTNGVRSQQLLWERCLEKGGQAELSNEILELLIRNFNSPQAAERLLDLMIKSSSTPQEAWEAITENASEVPVTLTTYLKALEVFLAHAKTRDCKTSLAKVMGYIQCSSEAGYATQELAYTVETMLNEFGFANEQI